MKIMLQPSWVAATLLISAIACVGEQPAAKPEPPVATPTPLIDQAEPEIPYLPVEDRMQTLKVQMAVISMMLAAGLKLLPSPVSEPTNDMSAFPDLNWPIFQAPTEDGLSTQNYFRTRRTRCAYVVDTHGVISQVSC